MLLVARSARGRRQWRRRDSPLALGLLCQLRPTFTSQTVLTRRPYPIANGRCMSRLRRINRLAWPAAPTRGRTSDRSRRKRRTRLKQLSSDVVAAETIRQQREQRPHCPLTILPDEESHDGFTLTSRSAGKHPPSSGNGGGLLALLPAPPAGPPSRWMLLIFSYACVVCLGGRHAVAAFDCDFIRVSNAASQLKNGTFSAPLLNGHTVPAHGLQCIYTFIALPSERVKLTFRDFKLAGRPPDCLHEYIDLYTELRNASEDLVQTDKFGGRFCGHIAPRPRISLYNTIVVVFSFDRAALTPHLFSGTYEFINASTYDMGSPVPPSSCSFVVQSWVKRAGNFASPTYPGVYPQRIMCSYQLLGQRGQRVRVEFMDFDLFYGGPHCPYDRVTIHDGATEQDPVINTHCGSQRQLIVFSSEENLFISFITNRSGGENRGFRAIFEFSETYVNLDFITGEHVRGTDCDQRILSTGRSSGLIKSPNSPLPYMPDVECRYFFEGLNNADDLERVRLTVEMFHMPQMLGARKGDCSEGGIGVWLNGKEEPREKPGVSLCGTHTSVTDLLSTDSRLLLKFYSGTGTTQGLGFTIRYQFETYFSVPGTPNPITTICEFRYNSETDKTGEFHSPRHPANYPSNINCTYILEGAANEQVHLEFDMFKLYGDGGYLQACNVRDQVQVYEVFDTGQESYDIGIGLYCGTATPPPIRTRAGVHTLKMVLVTDASGVTNGFRGRYFFHKEPEISDPPVRACGEDISNLTHGVIRSPGFDPIVETDKLKKSTKYPPNSDCDWKISVRPAHNILLNITYLSLEGDQNFSTCSVCGCPGAALKIFTDPIVYPIEMCGTYKPNNGEFRSHSDTIRVTFTTGSKATGSPGFEIIWNEFHYPIASECESNEFLCDKNHFCINSDLVCDHNYNCGENDTSDERDELCGTNEDPSFFADTTMLASVAGGGGGLLLIGCVTVFCVCRKRQREERRRKRQQNQQDQHHDWNS